MHENYNSRKHAYIKHAVCLAVQQLSADSNTVLGLGRGDGGGISYHLLRGLSRSFQA